jgi:hypothetical protein
MSITATHSLQAAYAAMMEQVKDYGGSLAKFTATQMAVPLLSEDWARWTSSCRKRSAARRTSAT